MKIKGERDDASKRAAAEEEEKLLGCRRREISGEMERKLGAELWKKGVAEVRNEIEREGGRERKNEIARERLLNDNRREREGRIRRRIRREK